MGHYNLFDYWCLMIGISVLCTALIACRHTVSGSISLPSPGFFSPFPHGTCALSVIRLVFSLGGWSPQLPTRFHVPCGTQDSASSPATFRLRACHPLRMSFPEHSAMLQQSYLRGPTTPNLQHKVQCSRFCVQCFNCFSSLTLNLELGTLNSLL